MKTFKELKQELSEGFAGVTHNGGPLDGKIDKRYSISKEYDGHASARHVARFGGDYLGSHETREGAKEIAQKHKDYRDRIHAGIRESISVNAEEMGIELSEEELDELSKKTLDSYIDKALDSHHKNYSNYIKNNDISSHTAMNKRRKGLSMAADKRNWLKFLTHEDVDQDESLDEAVHPDDALRILKKHTDIDDNTNFFSLKSHQVSNIEAERKKAKFSGRNSMGRSPTRQFYDHLHKQAAKSKHLMDESVDIDEARQPADEEAAHELVLHATNDHHLYKNSATPIIDNLKRKVKRGVYDHEKATKLWRYHADRAADHYKKAYGDGHFTPATRDMAAKEFRDHYDEHVRGE